MAQEKQTQDPYDIFQTGDKVKHPKFGEGTIMQRSGAGDATKLVVAFAEEGEKKLMAKYAKLKRLQPIESKEKEAPAGKTEEKPVKTKTLAPDSEEELEIEAEEDLLEDDVLDEDEDPYAVDEED